MNAKKQVEKLLDQAGITINGHNDFDPQVFNEKVYQRVLSGGSMALGESYMDGWWEAKALDKFFYKILKANLDKKFIFSWPIIISFLKSSIFNLQNKSRSFIIGERHYDIGNDLYKLMLGKTIAYSCGYWKNVPISSSSDPVESPRYNREILDGKTIGTSNLDKAQTAKFDLICQKIGLKKGDEILDIGCGWGSFLKFAAENYGVKGKGITVSKEQAELARELCKGLPIEISLQDYRALRGKFDHIISVGMFEHVGVKNYRVYMSRVKKLLKDDGLFLLHTIGSNQSSVAIDPWIEKYIFPNSLLPSVAQISKSIEGLFVMEDWHNFGTDYDKTLMAWFDNFNNAWPTLQQKYSEKFYRMWKYYLLSCAGGFRARQNQLWQIVLSKKGVPGGYKPIR